MSSVKFTNAIIRIIPTMGVASVRMIATVIVGMIAVTTAMAITVAIETAIVAKVEARIGMAAGSGSPSATVIRKKSISRPHRGNLMAVIISVGNAAMSIVRIGVRVSSRDASNRLSSNRKNSRTNAK